MIKKTNAVGAILQTLGAEFKLPISEKTIKVSALTLLDNRKLANANSKSLALLQILKQKTGIDFTYLSVTDFLYAIFIMCFNTINEKLEMGYSKIIDGKEISFKFYINKNDINFKTGKGEIFLNTKDNPLYKKLDCVISLKVPKTIKMLEYFDKLQKSNEKDDMPTVEHIEFFINEFKFKGKKLSKEEVNDVLLNIDIGFVQWLVSSGGLNLPIFENDIFAISGKVEGKEVNKELVFKSGEPVPLFFFLEF